MDGFCTGLSESSRVNDNVVCVFSLSKEGVLVDVACIQSLRRLLAFSDDVMIIDRRPG